MGPVSLSNLVLQAWTNSSRDFGFVDKSAEVGFNVHSRFSKVLLG